MAACWTGRKSRSALAVCITLASLCSLAPFTFSFLYTYSHSVLLTGIPTWRERGLQCRLLIYSNVLRERRVSTPRPPPPQFGVPNFSKSPLFFKIILSHSFFTYQTQKTFEGAIGANMDNFEGGAQQKYAIFWSNFSKKVPKNSFFDRFYIEKKLPAAPKFIVKKLGSLGKRNSSILKITATANIHLIAPLLI